MLQIAGLVNTQLLKNNFFQPGWNSKITQEESNTAIVISVSSEMGFIFQIEEAPRPGWVIFRCFTMENSWYGQKVVHTTVMPVAIQNWFLLASILQDYVNYMLIDKTVLKVQKDLEKIWEQS